jgi:hypothetical protein
MEGSKVGEFKETSIAVTPAEIGTLKVPGVSRVTSTAE